ncbi:MAG: SDR family oxidoreductase [Minisyncoccia bacterium]
MNDKTVLLTGATGQVVSELAMVLQKEGWRILYLIRSSSGKNAQARLAELLPTIRDGLDIAIDGDITLPFGGLSRADSEFWRGKIGKILHGAAAISFEEKDADHVWHTNVGGVQNMLELASVLDVKSFHYISTAYISGSAIVFHETDLDIGQKSFNAYELSKIESEKLVHGWEGGEFTIYRLPTVLGSSVDGRVLTFHSYYGFFMPFWRMLKSWNRRWLADKQKCTDEGVTFNEKGVMNIPLFIDCSSISVLNMVTVDWVAQMMSELLKMSSCGQTYHLVHQNPPKVKSIIEMSLRHLGISGVRYDLFGVMELKPLLAKIQTGINENTKIYQQYIKHGSVFTCDKLINTLGCKYIPHKDVDEAMLCLMLDYAMYANFGKK